MNIYVLNSLAVGLDMVNSLKKRIAIKGMIGLTKRKPGDVVSGYVYIKDYCRLNKFDFIPVETYSLKSSQDKKRLLALKIDVLLVPCWQRLIPDWLINHCRVCAIGAHGSPYGITKGRGRSPLNWTLILGKKKFFLSIFKIDSKIDSGGLIDTDSFSITDDDDIQSLHYKANYLVAEMMVKNIKNGKVVSGKTTPQVGEPRYFPKRLPEDGEIDWGRTTKQIDSFIRALTHPYPGAYSHFLKSRLFIWRARPFDFGTCLRGFKNGEIVKIYYQGELLVRTKDGLLLVDDYSVVPSGGQSHLKEGLVLKSTSFKTQMKRIIKRHQMRYPNLILNRSILGLVK